MYNLCPCCSPVQQLVQIVIDGLIVIVWDKAGDSLSHHQTDNHKTTRQASWKWLCQRWEHVQLENGLRTVPACLPACVPACLHTRGGGVEAGKQSYNMQEADECCLPIYLPLYWMLPCLIAHSCCPVLEHFLHIGNMSRDARFSKFVLKLCSGLWNYNLPR